MDLPNRQTLVKRHCSALTPALTPKPYPRPAMSPRLREILKTDMVHSLNRLRVLKGGYMGDYMRTTIGLFKGDTIGVWTIAHIVTFVHLYSW